MAIAGDLGATIDLAAAAMGVDDTSALFAESTGRFVCEVAAGDVDWLATELGEPVAIVGAVTAERTLAITLTSGVHTVAVDDLVAAFTGTAS